MYVMVVDDNEATRKRSMEILDKFQIGGQTFLYHSGRKAVDHVMCNPVDFAFVRRKLPDLSGEEVEERIRFLQPITKVYLMDEGEEILVSPCGEISIGAPIHYPWEEAEPERQEMEKAQKKIPAKGGRGMGKTAAVLTAVFLGGFGVPRFAAGKVGTGILWLLTGGCLGIGWLVDLIQIATGKFTRKDGTPFVTQ